MVDVNNLMSTDSLGRLIRSTEYDADNTIVQRTEHLYDEYSRLSSQSWVIQGDPFSESYTYNDPDEDNPGAPQDGSLKQMTTAIGATIDYNYDAIKRLSGTTVKNSTGATVFTHAYAYKNLATTNGITQTTSQVEYHNVRNSSGIVIGGAKYAYDEVGNIVGIYEKEPAGSSATRRLLVAYAYDVQNQLVSETYYTYSGNATLPSGTTTYAYTYDTAGNILTERKDGVLTKTYTYGNSNWNDLLTKVNGTTITYDEIGNPIQYYNGNSSYNMQWIQGRQLISVSGNFGQASYQYDLDGIRNAKYVSNVTHNFITQNGKVVRETIGTGATAKVLDFIYDESGKPFALKYTDGTAETKTYYYVLNLQGDVVELVEHTQTLLLYRLNTVATYTYNAWGEIVSATGEMAEINPLRYRGYYYDSETGFYYLQSRYYDPAMHRFINADSYQSTGQGVLGTNMFAYCCNMPTNSVDPTGHASWMTTMSVILENPEFGSGRRYIDDQSTATYSNWSLGESSIGKSGCGPVAVYNILRSRGTATTFFEIYSAAYAFDTLADNGKSGTTFSGMAEILYYFDPSCVSAQQIDEKNAQSMLILYGFYDCDGKRNGGHFVAAIGTGNGNYVFYNDPYISNEPMSYEGYVNELSRLRFTTDGTNQLYVKIDIIAYCG